MKNIIVFGGEGLIGKNLQNEIDDIDISNYNWIFCNRNDADLTNFKETENLYIKYKPYIVINLAAKVGGLYHNLNERVSFFRDNMLLNMNIIELCYKYNVNKLINILSTCIFPDNIDYPITEDKLHNGPPHYSNECYAYSKRMIDVISRAYNKQYNMNIVNLIIGNIYGPYDNFNIKNGHVIPALIHKFYLAHKNEQDITIFGSGNPLRQFTYVKDICKLIIWSIDNYNDIQPIILSTEQEISIKDVVNIISTKFNYKGNILYDVFKNDGQYKKTISNKKLLNINNYNFLNINEGIDTTIDWFINNYNKNIRK